MKRRNAKAIRRLFVAYAAGFDDANSEAVTELFPGRR